MGWVADMIAPKDSLGENWIRYTEVTEVLFSTGAIEGRDRRSVASDGGYIIGDRGAVASDGGYVIGDGGSIDV
jgi:hypothetical protein